MDSSSLLAIFLFSFTVALGAVISPGPVSTAIVSQSPQRGWAVGPLVAIGHALLELLIVVLITFGLSAGLAKPGVQTFIALLGGGLLVWMGGQMATDVMRGRLHLPGRDLEATNLNSGQLVGLGMIATISNPFWYAWWVAVAAGYLAQARAFSTTAIAVFYLGHVSADFLWDTTLSTIVGGSRRWITDRVYQALILVCASFLLYLGFVFLSRGIAGLGAA